MKMQYEDLFPLKIDIQTKNDRNFLELAILFDKPEFLEYLPRIRKKYQIDPIASLEEYERLIDGYSKSKESRFDLSVYENANELAEYANKNTIWFEGIQDEEMTKYQQLETEASILCYIFKRPPFFSDSIKQAIMCGSVNGNLFDTTSTTIVEQDMISSTTGNFQLPQVAILISPTSTDMQIKEQVQYARHLFKTDDKIGYYKPRVDKVNQIRLYRDWYWKSISGKRNTDILHAWESNPERDPDSDMDESRISKGISYYKKLLLI